MVKPSLGGEYPASIVDIFHGYQKLEDRQNLPYISAIIAMGAVSLSALKLTSDTNPLYITWPLLGFSLATVITGMKRSEQERSIANVRSEHLALEAEIGPFDIVRLPKSNKDDPARYAMRLYGIGGGKKLSIAETERLRSVIGKCDELGVGELAIGANWLDIDKLLAIKEDGGRILGADSAVDNLRRVGPFQDNISDKEVSGEVVSMAPNKLLKLLDKEVSDIRAGLIDRTGRTDWKELFHSAKAGDLLALERLQRGVRMGLEHALGGEAGFKIEGLNRDRVRTSTNFLVNGDQVTGLVQGLNPYVNERSATVGDSVSLLSHIGTESLDELVARIDANDWPSGASTDVLAALHLLLLENHKLETAKPDVDNSNAKETSLTSRLGLKPETYTHKISRLRQFAMLGGAAVAGLAMVVSSHFVGESGAEAIRFRDEGVQVYEQGLGPNQTVKDAGYRDLIYQNYGKEGLDKLSIANAYDSLKYLLEQAPLDVSTSLTGMFLDLENKQAVNGRMFSTVNFGDVLNEPNYNDFYKITPLKDGVGTAGYWAASFADNLVVGDIPIGNASDKDAVRMEKQDTSDADIMVETPFPNNIPYGDESDIWIPFKQGTKVIGAQVVDLADNQKIFDLDVFTKNGAYFTYHDRKKAVGMKEPAIRYYLKELPIDQPFPSSGSNYRYTKIYSENMPRYFSPTYMEDAGRIAAATRSALGLDDTATLDEIVKTVRSKEYSTTPFASSGTAPISEWRLDDLSDDKAWTLVGEGLSKMKIVNCNLATLLTIIATADMENVGLSVTHGFYVKQNGSLGAHAWLTDWRGNIHDPTPTLSTLGSLADHTKQVVENITDQLPNAFAVTLIGTVGMIAYRRRKDIAAWRDKRSTEGLDGEAMHQAVDILLQMRYAPSEQRLSQPKKPIDYGVPAWERYAMNIGSDFAVSVADIESRADYTVSSSVLRAIKKLQARRATTNRHFARNR